MKNLVLMLLKTYKATYPVRSFFVHMFIGPDGSECRFTPTCSDYMEQAVEKYGGIKGLYIGIKRLLRCHPWAKGGFDPIV